MKVDPRCTSMVWYHGILRNWQRQFRLGGSQRWSRKLLWTWEKTKILVSGTNLDCWRTLERTPLGMGSKMQSSDWCLLDVHALEMHGIKGTLQQTLSLGARCIDGRWLLQTSWQKAWSCLEILLPQWHALCWGLLQAGCGQLCMQQVLSISTTIWLRS